MDRSKFGRFLDNMVITIIAFILFFTIFKTLIKNNYVCLTLATILSFVALKILIYFQNRKYTKLSIKKDEIKKIDECNFQLRKMSTSNQLNFFKQLLSSLNITVSKNLLIIDNTLALTTNLTSEQISKQDIFSVYSQIREHKLQAIKEVVIICNTVTPEIHNFVQRFTDISFVLFSPVETYSLMKKFNYYPALPQNEKQKKKQPYFIIKQAFMRKHAKNFIRCGFVLYIAGIFVPFTKYYIIVASICLFIGAICLCFGFKEPNDNSLSKNLLLG